MEFAIGLTLLWLLSVAVLMMWIHSDPRRR